jgi:hypothetical protein
MGPPARVGVSARERWIRPTVSRATFLSRREDETTTPRTRPLSLPSRLLTHGRSCCTNDSVCVWTDRPFTYSLWSPLSNNARYRHTCLLAKKGYYQAGSGWPVGGHGRPKPCMTISNLPPSCLRIGSIALLNSTHGLTDNPTT